ncbi:MAG: prepilin-type N-terminal cleavage/methylation domain-containing protein [Clostridium sp.]|jgi:type IV pilus assembly protein PilA
MLKNLRNKLNEKKNKKGFTLIELIIVIAIIAILAALLLPKIGAVKENSNKTSDIANAKKIAEAVLSLNAEDKLEPFAAKKVSEVDTLKSYLQNVPKTKSNVEKNKEFKVSLDANGSVTVTTEGGKKLYPTPATDYDAK